MPEAHEYEVTITVKMRVVAPNVATAIECVENRAETMSAVPSGIHTTAPTKYIRGSVEVVETNAKRML